MFLIRQWASLPEDLEILWLAGVFRSERLGWQVRVMARGLSSGKIYEQPLPIGILPLLTPGQSVSGGQLMTAAATGLLSSVQIPNLAEGEEVDAADSIPRSLYSFHGHRGWGQRLLRYRVGWKTYLIPTIELVRFLFLHNKTLARAIMQPAGLLALAVPKQPGFHQELHLDFTWHMPRRSLDTNFVKEFAWLAVHPEGRRSWDSVLERSRGNRYVTLAPPRLACEIVFRGVQWRSAWLVLEISGISGRYLPCEQLTFSHPTERCIRLDGAEPGSRHGVLRRSRSEPKERKVWEHEVQADVGSRRDGRQKALPLLNRLSSFENDVPVRKVRLAVAPARASEAATARDGAELMAHESGPDGNVVGCPRTRVIASVGDEAIDKGLPPVEFQLLESADWAHAGETEWLVAAVRMIAEEFPDIQVSMSLCFLKRGRAFSMINRDRRTCLVAVFRLGDLQAVLVDVNHAGIRGLAGLMLRYTRACSLLETEKHLQTVLDALVDCSGKWDAKAEEKLPDFVTCRRLPKVLRRQGKRSKEEYLRVWVERLVERMWG